MKLQMRILLLGLIPALLVGLIAFFLSTFQMKKAITVQAFSGMEGTALAIGEVFANSGDGEYQIIDGEMWKGDSMNISAATSIVDSIKDQTGFDVTVFYEGTRMLTTLQDASGNRQVGTQASDEVINEVENKGQTFESDNVTIFDTRYIVYYVPLYQTGTQTPVGMIFLGQPYSRVNSIIISAATAILGSMVLILIIATLLIIYNVKRIANPILQAINYLGLMGEGNLGVEIDEKILKSAGEIGDMCRQIKVLDDNLVEIVTAIKDQIEILNDTYEGCSNNTQHAMESTDQIDDTVNGLSLANTSLADDALTAGDSVEIISGIIENTTVTMKEFAETADSMEHAAESAKTTLSELNDSMNEVMAAVDEVYGKTSETHESVNKIANMVNVISEIAAQTNLLSLNASIEAARAGEMGKGFAVVAGEIQSLAEQSDQSAKEIQNVLDQLVANSNQSVETMDKMQSMIETQKNKIGDTNSAFEGVGEGIEKTMDGIANISDQMQKLSEARNNTSDTVQNVASIAQENAASAQETASNMSEIASQIQDIKDQIKELGNVASILNDKVGAFSL